MQSIKCSAPGRICLFGDHMDWCGFQVITAAISKRIFLEGKLNYLSTIRLESFPPFSREENINLVDMNYNIHSDFRYVYGVIKAYKQMKPDFSLGGLDLRFYRDELYYDLPAGKGLSSSAAMSVVTAGMIDLLHRRDDELVLFVKQIPSTLLSQYAEIAYFGERYQLGINCGQMDQYASAHGGFLYIDCQKPISIEKIPSIPHIRLVIGDTKQSKDTPKILKWLGDRYLNQESLIWEGIKEISDIVQKAKHELFKEKPNIVKLGELMNKNQHFISNNLKISGNCPISPSNLDKLIDAANSAGAFGSKVTGSGGGGCMVALCSENNCDEVSRQIINAGGDVTINQIPDVGFKIESVT